MNLPNPQVVWDHVLQYNFLGSAQQLYQSTKIVLTSIHGTPTHTWVVFFGCEGLNGKIPLLLSDVVLGARSPRF